MKRILLVAAIALVTLSASAVNRPLFQKAPRFANEKKSEVTTWSNVKSMEAALKAKKTELEANKTLQISAVSRADEVSEPELIPAYSEWTYAYFNLGEMRGFMPQIMYDGASFLVDGETAYFAPFEKLGYVEGVLVGTQDFSAQSGGTITADVYEFTSAVIAETNSGIQLSLEPCDVVDYTAVRSGATTFQAYYFSDNEEFYLPADVCLALFDVNSSETDVWNDLYVARMLDLMPQDFYKPYISKGTFTGKTYYDSRTNLSGDCEIFIGYDDVYYVKGADGINEDAWVEYDVDESDPSIATLFSDQYIGSYNFYSTDPSDTEIGIVATVGLLQSNGSLSAFNSANDYISEYKITDNPDGTTTIANTNNTVYGDYIYMESGGGMYNALDLNITILWEEAYDTGIKGVTAETNKDGAIYNLAGQRVSNDFKGIVIKDGKKVIMK